jgi:hypothetical protein
MTFAALFLAALVGAFGGLVPDYNSGGPPGLVTPNDLTSSGPPGFVQPDDLIGSGPPGR